MLMVQDDPSTRELILRLRGIF